MLSSDNCFMEGPHRKCRGRHKAASYNFNTLGHIEARSASSTTEYHPARVAREPRHGRFEHQSSLHFPGIQLCLPKQWESLPVLNPTNPLGVQWFRGMFNQTSTLPTHSPSLRPGGSWSLVGVHRFHQAVLLFPATFCNTTLEKYTVEPPKHNQAKHLVGEISVLLATPAAFLA